MTLAKVRDGKFRNSLAKMTSLTETSDLLAKTEAISKYKAKLDKDGEEARSLAEQVLEIKAKIGELLPARPREDRNQGRGGNKSITVPVIDFHENTITAFRKIARHKDDLDAYFDTTDDIPSQIGFLKYLSDIGKTNRKKASAEKLRSATLEESEACEVTSNQASVQCDVIITDPPYGVLDQPWEPVDLEKFTRDWASRWSDSGARCMAIFWSQNFLWDGKRWFDESLQGYHLQQLLIWHYPNSMMKKAGPNFKNSWDPVFFYLKDGETPDITVNEETWGDGLSDMDCLVAAIPQSNFSESEEKLHPAQKPVKVMRWLVSTLSLPGELVVDPFCGSGTTGVAARQLGRRFHGVEISDEYSTLAKSRIAAFGKADE